MGGGGGDCWRAITVKPVQYEYLNPDLFLQREFIHSLEREGGGGGGGEVGGGGSHCHYHTVKHLKSREK